MLKVNFHAGLVACGIIAALQALIEVLGLGLLYNGYIFRPQDLYKSQIFLLARRMLNLGRHSSMPLFLDEYLGPGSIDQLPVFFTITGVYAALSLVVGICLGFMVWLKRRKGEIHTIQIYRTHLSIAIACWLPLNVLIYLLKILERGYTPVQQKFLFLAALVIALCVIWLLFKISRYLLQKWDLPGSKTSRLVALLPVVMLLIASTSFSLNILRNSRRDQVRFETYNLQTSVSGLNQPNLILISIDSLRADHLSSYGYVRKTSPHIDSLAKDGFLFENAFSSSSWTLPAHRSLLTSTFAEENDFFSYMDPLSRKQITMAEVLKTNGYTTAGFVSGTVLASSFGLNQGFELYDDFSVRFKKASDTHRQITSPALHQAISTWLKANSDKKFFLFLHYWDVHYDYNPPAPFDKMFDPDYNGKISNENFIRNKQINKNMDPRDLAYVLSQYDGEIAYTDSYIGKLLDELKRLDLYNESMIILTADHGDEFFEHGYKGHMRTLYEEVLRIPLVIKFPSSSKFGGGNKISNLVSIVDVMPTALEYLKIKTPPQAQGRNLLSVIKGDPGAKNYLLYASLRNEMFALRSANTKFVQRSNLPGKEFFDLQADPLEKLNLYKNGNRMRVAEADRQLDTLVEVLNRQRQSLRSRSVKTSEGPGDVDDSVQEQLKALGYVQ